MKALTIKTVEFFMFGDPDAHRFQWADHIDDVHITTTMCKLTTEDGYVGIGGGIAYTEGMFDRCNLESGKQYVSGLVGKSALDREALWSWMSERPTVAGMHAVAMIDVALWDLVGQYAKLPLYQLLGASRDKILAYASSPYFPTVEEYVDYVGTCIEAGFKAVKIHPYSQLAKDMVLIDTLQENYGGKIVFTLDGCGRYSRMDACKIGKKIEGYGWAWFEEPISDRDIAGYRYLMDHLSVPISASGNSQISGLDVVNAINAGAWTDVRADVTSSGGITPTRKLSAVAEACGMKFELQSWGSTLAHAANLHLMLACNHCTYFELAYPMEQFEIGMKTVVRPDAEGYIHAPEGYGLGIEVDWDEIKRLSIETYSSAD